MNLDFSSAQVLVVGDVMLDRYFTGNAQRISPEAPVPVVNIEQEFQRLGGAGNVALGIKALGAKVMLQGIIGNDSAGFEVKSLLEAERVDYDLVETNQAPTITKLRIIAKTQQMLRIDTETQFSLNLAEKISPIFNKHLSTKQAVVFSDYAKGTLSDIQSLIAQAKKAQVLTLVDPKLLDFAAYDGADVITPNLKEFTAVVGECSTLEELVQKALILLKQHNIGALVITRSEQGMSVVLRDGKYLHIPAIAREVFDVTGAGDTVIAVLASALSSGYDLMQAARLSNIAASIAVSRLGAATVTAKEIQSKLEEQQAVDTSLGVVTEQELLRHINKAKAQQETIVFTNGCFDLLHEGHVKYLEQAKKLGDRLIVAVNVDATVRQLKGDNRPVNSLNARMTVLAALRAVDWVIAFSELTPERLISVINPDILVKGGDYNDVMAIPGAKFVLANGGQVKLLTHVVGCSTTAVIEKIATQ